MRLTKKGTTNLIAMMNYSQAFGQSPPEHPFDFLRQYPTDMILLRVSKINAILYLEDDVLVQNVRVLKEVIFDELPAIDQTLNALGQVVSNSQQSVFSGPVMSVIIKETLEHYTPAQGDKSVNVLTFAGNLFKAILAYNEHYYDSTGKAAMESFEGLFTLDIQQQYYLRRERYLKLSLLLKFAFIGKFLSEDVKLKKPALEYCRVLQIGTVWGLAQFLLHMFNLLLRGDRAAKHILKRNGADWPVMEQFVVRKADLVKGELSLHKEVVPKPFYEIDDEHLLLLDFNYFTFGLDQGLLFSIYNKTSLRENLLFKNYNAYQGYVGLHYFEQYYVGRFIKTIFSKWNQRVVSTDKYQDYLVRAGNNVFIIEVKMTGFNANGLDKESFTDFRDFIDQNFLGKTKGLLQIIRQLGYLANDPKLHELLGFSKPEKMNIYPIIVYSDANLDMTGVNEYVNQQVPQYLTPYTEVFQTIRPLTMINGTFFMNYYYLLRKDPTVFAEWLNNYIKSIGNLKKRYREDQGPFNYLLFNKSFAEHIRRNIPKEDFELNLTALSADFDIEVRDFGKNIS